MEYACHFYGSFLVFYSPEEVDIHVGIGVASYKTVGTGLSLWNLLRTEDAEMLLIFGVFFFADISFMETVSSYGQIFTSGEEIAVPSRSSNPRSVRMHGNEDADLFRDNFRNQCPQMSGCAGQIATNNMRLLLKNTMLAKAILFNLKVPDELLRGGMDEELEEYVGDEIEKRKCEVSNSH